MTDYENANSPVADGTFDPIALGFTEYIPRRYVGGRALADEDYIRYTDAKSGRNMVLSLCEETAEFVTTMFGETVNVYSNEKGHILVTSGRNCRVRIPNNSSNRRRDIGITGISDRVIGANGNFKRLFVTAKPYARGDALLFVPNGERDL